MSLHGRTLVEMAVVRIAALEDLDDLASLAAELRGEAPTAPPRPRVESAKKNAEPPPAASLGTIPPLPATTPEVPAEPPERREPEPVAVAPPPEPTENGEASEPIDSVLKQFQLAVEAKSTNGADAEPVAPRVSRRQQLAEQTQAAMEQPFVKRALELFDVGPGQFRYSPPDGD